MVADFLTLEGAGRKRLFIQFIDGPYSTAAPCRSVGQSLPLFRLRKFVRNESVRGVAKGPEINDLWIASDCAWSHALVLLDLRKTTKERTVNGPDSIQFWMLPRRNCYLCVLCRPEYLSVTQFPLDAACILSTSIQV